MLQNITFPVKVSRGLAALEPPIRNFKKNVVFPEFTGLLLSAEHVAPSEDGPSVSGLMAWRWDGMDQSWCGSNSLSFFTTTACFNVCDTFLGFTLWLPGFALCQREEEIGG